MDQLMEIILGRSEFKSITVHKHMGKGVFLISGRVPLVFRVLFNAILGQRGYLFDPLQYDPKHGHLSQLIEEE